MDIKVVENENQVYRKEKLLGEGAFGKAYLVKKVATEEMLVIKEMNIQHMSQKEKEQTIKEALILKNLNHPNIVHFNEVYVTKQNKLKIVMEYAECGDLAKAIHQRKAKKNYISEIQVLDWFTQICLAIKHVHDRKILHRDIKGQNIFIGANNSLKLGDFGIARVLNKTMEKARTVVGTPYYLSPEIIQNKPYSFKSDIWSMGAVLYELCALQPPFNASSLQMLALKIVKGSYPSLQGNYSKQMKALIAEMLTLDPNRRPSVNDILKKEIIQDRIKKFLTETKRNAEFSHTILHNHKVDLGGVQNKLVQIQKQKQQESSRNNSAEKKLEKERLRLKQEQQQMEQLMKKKKSEDERKKREEYERNERKKKEQFERMERKKRQEFERRRREQEDRRRSEEKKLKDEARKRQQAKMKQEYRKQWIEKEKMRQYEENRRMAQYFKQKANEEESQYQKQRQIQRLQRQKDEYYEKMRKQKERERIQQKKMEKQQRQLSFQEAARQQYFENLQIRKRAEERARRQREGDYSQHHEPQNYHYAQKRPSSKQENRPSSRENKNNFSDCYQSAKHVQQPEQSRHVQLKVDFKKAGSQIKSSERRQVPKRPSVSELRERDIEKEDKKKKIEEAREKMKKDREAFVNKNKFQENQTEVPSEKQETKVGKWAKKKSIEKRESSREESPRFGDIEQPKKIDDFSVIRDSENLFLEVKDEKQLNAYINELEDLVQGVNQKVQILPDLPVSEEVVFREDDELQFSLTAEKALSDANLEKMKNEEVDLDYFSNYASLEILRMQLEQAFGLQNFIKLYRLIEAQVNQKGLEGFDILQIQKEVGQVINRETFSKNITLLLTLVSLEDKMNYT